MKIRLLAILSLAGLGLISVAQPSNAQALPSNQSTNLQNYDSRGNDPFYQGTEQSPFDMFRLIHNANLGLNRYNPEFANQQRREIDEAAEAFRARQQQRLQQGNLAQPTQQTPIIKLEPSN
ncbi:MAG: hypothetical protein IGS39_25085 [Calothrix sp. C42_A2020_038]|nr:hypothetical protein [Calothrix sp. C42_A2020_038]